MEKIKLTVNFIKKLTPGQNVRIADTEVPGLQVRVGASAVSYYLRKRQGKKIHEIAIGRHPDITLEEARQIALEKLGSLANYQEINSPSARKQPTVRDAVEMLVSSVRRPVGVTSVMQRWQFLFDKKIYDVTNEEVKSAFENMKDIPSSANHAIRYLRTAINKIAKRLNIPNPAGEIFADIKEYPESPRIRYLLPEEAPKAIDALKQLRGNYRYSAQADAILLMLYTGQRKSRVLKMHSSEIDVELKQWEVPGNNIKRPVTHPFNDRAWEIVEPRLKAAESGYLFLWRGKPLSDCRKTFVRVCQMCGIKDLTIYDLRRSLGTWMLSSGASIESVSKTLGHSSIRVTEQVYAHLLASKGRSDTEKAVDAMLDGKI